MWAASNNGAWISLQPTNHRNAPLDWRLEISGPDHFGSWYVVSNVCVYEVARDINPSSNSIVISLAACNSSSISLKWWRNMSCKREPETVRRDGRSWPSDKARNWGHSIKLNSTFTINASWALKLRGRGNCHGGKAKGNGELLAYSPGNKWFDWELWAYLDATQQPVLKTLNVINWLLAANHIIVCIHGCLGVQGNEHIVKMYVGVVQEGQPADLAIQLLKNGLVFLLVIEKVQSGSALSTIVSPSAIISFAEDLL